MLEEIKEIMRADILQEKGKGYSLQQACKRVIVRYALNFTGLIIASGIMYTAFLVLTALENNINK